MVVDPHTDPGGHLPEQGTTGTEQCGKRARTDPHETRLQIIIGSFYLQHSSLAGATKGAFGIAIS
jgi:hypothetical protein